MSEAASPLEDIRVIDLTDEYGAYAGRLLAGLGAEVILVASDESDDARSKSSAEPDRIDVFREWADAGKKSVSLAGQDKQEDLESLVRSADIVLSSDGGRPPGEWLEVNPSVVHVVMSPFGWGLSPSWGPVDDLIVLGSGGLLHLGGYLDTGPIGAYGNQSQVASGIFGAIASLVGLIERRSTGRGSYADVSAQEAIAQALEDSLPTYALTGELKGPRGESAREAGTGVYACADGYVSMVAGRLGTARAWASLVEWLSEDAEDASELTDNRWSDFSFRQTDEASDRFREIFEAFASDLTKEALYLEAQSRGIALSPVSDIGDLLNNEQLKSRNFFHTFRHDGLGCDVTVPGPPFLLSKNHQPNLESAPDPGSDTSEIMDGLEVDYETSQAAKTG